MSLLGTGPGFSPPCSRSHELHVRSSVLDDLPLKEDLVSSIICTIREGVAYGVTESQDRLCTADPVLPAPQGGWRVCPGDRPPFWHQPAFCRQYSQGPLP